MIWATPAEIRAYRDGDGNPVVPAELDEIALAGAITSAVRSLAGAIVRWPVEDPDTGRSADEAQRAHLVAAVAETIRARRKAAGEEQDLGGGAAAAVIAAGGSVSAGKLSVSGGSRANGAAGALVGVAARRPPMEAWEALAAAGLIGGSVSTW